MDAAPRALRPLDPAERYFWLLGHCASVTGLLMAELDRRLEPDDIARALLALQRRHPLLRARVEVVDGEPVFVATGGEIPLAVVPVGQGEPIPYAALLGWTFGPAPDPLARCVYLPVQNEDRSALVLMVDHTIIDGSTCHVLLRQLLQGLERPDSVGPPSDVVPPPVHERFPEPLRSPRAVLDVLAAIRAERAGRPEPSGFPFHARHVTARRFRHDQLVLDPPAAKRFSEAARAEGSGVSGRLAAAVLRASAALFPEPGERTLLLGSATDLRARVEPPLPADEVTNAMGMLCSPHLVTPDENDTLGRAIAEQIDREVARGESHLFYRFARAGTYAGTDAGIESFARAVDASPHNITVSNLGRLSDEGLPAWARQLSTTMGPGSNQLAFVTAMSFRGALVVNVATDLAKLEPDLAEQLVSGIAARTGARRVTRSSEPDGVAV